jgi:NADP-reducing hydrogenase subunit HndA
LNKTAKTVLPESIVRHIETCRARENSESYVIAVLQQIQNHFGYLPREAMDEVSQLMQIPAAKVTGIATFYHFFSFVPRGEHRVTICMGTACFVRGADKLMRRFEELLGVKEGQTTPDGKFSIECARCLGACALAPVVVVNEKVYGGVTPGDVEKILGEYGFKKPRK